MERISLLEVDKIAVDIDSSVTASYLESIKGSSDVAEAAEDLDTSITNEIDDSEAMFTGVEPTTANDVSAEPEEKQRVENLDLADNEFEADDMDIESLDELLSIVKSKPIAFADDETENSLTILEADFLDKFAVSDDALDFDATNQISLIRRSVSDFIVDEAAETSGEDFAAFESASPAATSDLLVTKPDKNAQNNSDMKSTIEADPIVSEQDQALHDNKREEDEHATITAVTEEPAKATSADENLVDVLAKIRYKLACESVQVLDSGEIVALPKGWTTRQSKTNDGKTYFVSPFGHTQWLRPPMKTGIIYNWVHEIEVTFGPGRLGLNLKQIAGIPGTQFTDLQVHIAEIYKLPNGMASPAEIYNWSVKPEKRLAVNMRVTEMNGISLTGYTYSEVLELLARMPRPVGIKFADVSKGIVGRVEKEIPVEETEEEKEARAARVMQRSLHSEYFQILVSYELHKQVWATTRHHMRLQLLDIQKKNEVVGIQVELEQQRRESLTKERELLVQETVSLTQVIDQLGKQLAGKIDSPEVLRTAELARRNAVLEKEVTEIIAENDELQASRVRIEDALDDLQQELEAYGNLDVDRNGSNEVKFFSPAFLGSMVHRGSIDTRAEDARERLLEKIKAQRSQFEEEIFLEEERARFVESEIYQFKSQISLAAEAVKREDAFISGERPPQMIFLENKIALLKKNLRETVAGIVKARQSGDQQQTPYLFTRRADLKDDLIAALEEMRRMENELSAYFDVVQKEKVESLPKDISLLTVNIDEAPHERALESSRLQKKLAKLQVQLHETVVQLAKAAAEMDEDHANYLGKRRLLLKDEMKAVQDQFEALTMGTLNVAVNNRESYVRPSLVGPPTIQDAPRRSTAGSRISLSGGFRGSITSTWTSMAPDRASNISQTSEIAPRSSERQDLPLGGRSSSNGSMALRTQCNALSSIHVPGDESMPTMSGILRKHATYSNEKSTFGNMSLRGVRERWFNIEPDGYLRYYKREGDREPRGAILLKQSSLEILHGKEVGKPNEFMICSPTHQTRMLAKTCEEMLVWVKVLELAHAYFMQQVLNEDGHGNSTDHAVSPDAELAYRNKRATLGF